jgi:hypothetical protein
MIGPGLRLVPDLDAACKRIAAEFLTAVVEPLRQEIERISRDRKPDK